MSRILRRPMFRGGSPNNGGIMSYAQPRKGYEGAGYVTNGFENEEEIGAKETTANPLINGPQMKQQSNNIKQQNKT